jgi:hypothetical protein
MYRAMRFDDELDVVKVSFHKRLSGKTQRKLEIQAWLQRERDKERKYRLWLEYRMKHGPCTQTLKKIEISFEMAWRIRTTLSTMCHLYSFDDADLFNKMWFNVENCLALTPMALQDGLISEKEARLISVALRCCDV